MEKVYVVGIVLKASEVKDYYNGKYSVKGSSLSITNNRPFIMKSYFYSTNYRDKELLLNKKEIMQIISMLKQKKKFLINFTDIYRKNNLLKLDLVIEKFDTYKKRPVETKRDKYNAFRHDMRGVDYV